MMSVIRGQGEEEELEKEPEMEWPVRWKESQECAVLEAELKKKKKIYKYQFDQSCQMLLVGQVT